MADSNNKENKSIGKKASPLRVVIKVGTSVLTQANQRLDYNVIHHIVEQIGELHKKKHQVLLVTSGAAGASHGLGAFDKVRDELPRLQMMAAVGQPRLMQVYADFCREHQISVAQALLTRYDFGNRERYLSIRNVLEGLLKRGLLPIINENDVVAGEALTFGDNDYLSAAVASTVGAHRLFLLTTSGGFFKGGDPAVNQDAELISEVDQITPEMWASCQPTLSMGGRGGMYSKLKAAEMATTFGIETFIASGKAERVVPRIMENEPLGTRFPARAKRLKSYRQWLRFGAITNGRIVVDAGAEKALHNNKSLLPAGVVGVEGTFEQGEVVEIHTTQHKQVGVGVIEISSEMLREMINGTREIYRSMEAIHKDRLLIV